MKIKERLIGNDRGFSLVELIVVVAIMAVLIGVLAPAYMGYVEKARAQADDTAAGELFRVAEIVVLSGDYAESANRIVLTFNASGVEVPDSALQEDLEAGLSEMFGEYATIVAKSKTYQDKTYTIRVEPQDDQDRLLELVGAWEDGQS